MAHDTGRPRGRRGDGSTYETADGRWRAAVTLPDLLTGRPVRKYLSARSPTELRRKLAATRNAGAATAGHSPALGPWLERWLATVAVRVRPATLRNYRGALRRHVIPALGRIELSRLRPSDVEVLMATLIERDHLAASTAALTRRVLVIALTDAVRDGIVARNVAEIARPPRQAEPVRRALSADEARRFLGAIAGEPLEPLATLALTTGLRRGELLALRWIDVDVARGSLSVRRAMARSPEGGYRPAEPKSRRAKRTITLAGVALAALARRRADQDTDRVNAGELWSDPDGLVFTDPLGRPWAPETITDAWRRLVSRSGIGGRLRLHDMRHTAATLALSAGIPVRDVADALGHASPSITLDIYGHTVAEGPDRVAASIDRAIGGGAA
jgi:integrase